MVELSTADFGSYFEKIHGVEPFPWQARLLGEVALTGAWPELLDLPTGTGKTAAIDVALFHLALDAARPAAERTAPRRIVMVVDRRTVVDQAFERARTIKDALDRAEGGVLRTIADRLRSLSVTDSPLALAQLRGGMPRDDSWARRPDQPLVAVSTVDQVGSRLLFRGYGLSDAMRPIHAGLLGNDTLILLDEVHLSRPFQETLAALRGYRAWASAGIPDRWQVVEMSATPGGKARKAFSLSAEDRVEPRLAKRLGASKPVESFEVKASGAEVVKRAALAEACAERASNFAAPGRVVGVVLNRVATARETFVSVRKRLGNRARVFLVTGRMRPLERDDLDREIAPLVRSGRTRDASAMPIVIVSTQCIEAGADFDFDGLVTECASLDALRQRFGRLNRLGAIDDAQGVVLARSDSVGKDVDDPIYGGALAETWRWLTEAPRNFGIDAMAPTLPEGEQLLSMLVPPMRAPVMLPGHLDLLAQTKPSPEPDPDVSLWLHGVDQRQQADVQVVWRTDLTEAMLRHGMDDDLVREALLARVEVCPPVGLEAITLPLHAVRAWLTGEKASEVADVEGRSTEPAEERHFKKEPSGLPALLWRAEDSRVVDPDKIHPGATIIVPSAYGGIADRAWDPTSIDPVPDLGDRARWQQTRRPTLRLHAAMLDPAWPRPLSSASDDGDEDDRQAAEVWLEAMRSAPMAESWRRDALHALAKSRRRRAIVRLAAVPAADEPGYLAIVGRVPVHGDAAGDATTEDDGSSHTGVEVTLRSHTMGVSSWARQFAEHCGLPQPITRDIELAARWHDAGKVDPRFQRMLQGGSAFKTEVAPEPLAKSRAVAADSAARAKARECSGYPHGARHEIASLALLQAHAPLLAEATDSDLVLHLIASHHGHCRPFAPAVPDPDAVDLEFETGTGLVRTSSDHGLARLDAGVPDRFWRLIERYGWFGLAWFEAILRLADHRRSEEEQRMKEEP